MCNSFKDLLGQIRYTDQVLIENLELKEIDLGRNFKETASLTLFRSYYQFIFSINTLRHEIGKIMTCLSPFRIQMSPKSF